METPHGASNDRSEIERLKQRVEQLTSVILNAADEEPDSLASRYMQARMENIMAPKYEKIGRVEMLDAVISLVYEHYFMYNRNFHGKDSDRTIQMRNLIHDLREMQVTEMDK